MIRFYCCRWWRWWYSEWKLWSTLQLNVHFYKWFYTASYWVNPWSAGLLNRIIEHFKLTKKRQLVGEWLLTEMIQEPHAEMRHHWDESETTYYKCGWMDVVVSLTTNVAGWMLWQDWVEHVIHCCYHLPLKLMVHGPTIFLSQKS